MEVESVFKLLAKYTNRVGRLLWDGMQGSVGNRVDFRDSY